MLKGSYCIVGFGVTGSSVLDFLLASNINDITVVDDNQPISVNSEKYASVRFQFGSLDIPSDIDNVIVSPGIKLPAKYYSPQAKMRIMSDLELFVQCNPGRIVAVTGSNGKTTVVTLLAQIANNAGIKAIACGNIGTPVLSTLNKQYELFVLEVSSFQLELLKKLPCEIAAILNITPDHMDRHADFTEYRKAKLKIYQNAKHIVYNVDDHNTIPDNLSDNDLSFSTLPPKQMTQFGIKLCDRRSYLMHGLTTLMEVTDFAKHMQSNFSAIAAIAHQLQIPKDVTFNTLQNFNGLEHRLEFVANFNQVAWFNDSKGTNAGATLAALTAVAMKIEGRILLILGGDHKGADLSILKPAIKQYCRKVLLIGASSNYLLNILQADITCKLVTDMQQAVTIAANDAHNGDGVLLSPACSSVDMFDNYKHRGNVFKQIVLSKEQNA